jgi:hypothetical protein
MNEQSDGEPSPVILSFDTEVTSCYFYAESSIEDGGAFTFSQKEHRKKVRDLTRVDWIRDLSLRKKFCDFILLLF